MQVHVARDLDVLGKREVKVDLFVRRVVAGLCLRGHRLNREREARGLVVERRAVLGRGRVEVELLVLGALDRPGLLGALLLVVHVVAVHDVQADARRHLPAVVDALEVAVVVAQQVLEVLGVVGVRPLEVPVRTHPLEVAAAAPPGVERARQVEVRPAGSLVDGNLDLAHVRALVVPVGVHVRVHLGHGDLVVNAVGARHLRCDELVEREGRNATLEEALAVEVGRALPGRNAGQVGRAGRSDAPLVHGHAGVARHAHSAVGPGLGRDPLHEVVAVLAILVREHVNRALGVARATHVHVGHDVALVAPEERIGRLELGALGDRRGGHAHDLPLAHAVARALAKP